VSKLSWQTRGIFVVCTRRRLSSPRGAAIVVREKKQYRDTWRDPERQNARMTGLRSSTLGRVCVDQVPRGSSHHASLHARDYAPPPQSRQEGAPLGRGTWAYNRQYFKLISMDSSELSPQAHAGSMTRRLALRPAPAI
jgi:hypothetical protein